MKTLYAMILLLLAFTIFLSAAAEHPTMATGAPAPDFQLPGIDGKTYKLADFAPSKILAVIFTCNHCPTAQLYESRIKKLVDSYQGKSVAFVAIEPNNPNAVRLDEMGYTDVGDSFEDMKIRAAYRIFNFPYLYDGEDQKISLAYGPAATPHIFVFDEQRKLRYDGRLDNSQRESYVTRQDAREAIDALLNGRAIAVAHTPSVGCSTKWIEKSSGREAEKKRLDAEPVTVSMAGKEDLQKLRQNPSGKVQLVNFWATWCAPCVAEMPQLITTYNMYRHRPFDLVFVSANFPDEKEGVIKRLTENHASNRNLLFGDTKTYDLMAAFDPEWNAAVPYTMLIGADGKVLYRHQGPLDILEIRRIILANLPEDDYKGHPAYWKTR